MNSVVEDIKDMLVAESALGLTFATNLHLYKEPATPGNVVTIFETPGMPPIGTLDSNETTKHYEKPSIQVRVRNKVADTGFALAYQIQSVLHARAHETWGDYYYSSIMSIGNPAMVDWDDNSRIRIVINFNIQRRLV